MLLCVAGKHLEGGEPVLAHHHGLKLVEVHGPAPVLVHLLNDVLEVVLGEGAVNLPQNLLQHLNHKGSSHGRMNYKDTKPFMSAFLSVDLLTDFAKFCLTDFIDWRYIHSWFVFSTQLVNCCPH
jgi:hypothetical protein